MASINQKGGVVVVVEVDTRGAPVGSTGFERQSALGELCWVGC